MNEGVSYKIKKSTRHKRNGLLQIVKFLLPV